MKNLLLVPFVLFCLCTSIFAQDEEAAPGDSVTVICDNLLQIILSHEESYFESLEGEVLYMQDDSLKTEWDPNIYLIDGTQCLLSDVWGARTYKCKIEDGLFSNTLDEIYDMMKLELMDCLGEYCEFGETTEKELDDGMITYKRMWAKINEYFDAGIFIGLYEDNEQEKYFELQVY